MEDDKGKNISSNKRLANAKKKLQEYKNQKKTETGSSSSSSSPIAPTPPARDETEIQKLDTEIESVKVEELANGGVPEQLETLSPSYLETSTATSFESQTYITPIQNLSSPTTSTEALIDESPAASEVSEPLTRLTTTTENFVLNNYSVPPLEIPAVETAEVEKKVTMESSTQCEAEEKQKASDVIDELEKHVSILRKENEALGRREAGLVQQLETSEKLIRDLRKEVNQFKQQGNVHQQLEELQSAMVVVSKSKMSIAEELSNEQDKNKELLANLGTYETELQSLRTENGKLWTEINTLKARLEEEVMKNQVLEDQRRHFSVQVETLQAKLNSLEKLSLEEKSSEPHQISTTSSGAPPVAEHSHHHHTHSECSGEHHDHDEHDHHDEHHTHNGHDCHGDHEHESHGDHQHDSHGGHQHDTHAGPHQHPHSNHTSMSSESRKLVEMEKTLKRMEWENKTYEAELMKLAPLKGLEPQCQELRERNKALKEEVEHLEHLVIQLQGENDTIGDYITLYQTQKLALREHAKENAQLVEALSKEKDELLHKLSELSHAVEKLAAQPHGEVLESQIRDLIDDVNTKVHEPYTCSVCSGSRLMTV